MDPAAALDAAQAAILASQGVPRDLYGPVIGPGMAPLLRQLTGSQPQLVAASPQTHLRVSLRMPGRLKWMILE
jgi:hypothetical protein